MIEVAEQRSGLESQSKAEHQEKRFERIKCNHMVAQIQGGGGCRGGEKKVQVWNESCSTAVEQRS